MQALGRGSPHLPSSWCRAGPLGDVRKPRPWDPLGFLAGLMVAEIVTEEGLVTQHHGRDRSGFHLDGPQDPRPEESHQLTSAPRGAPGGWGAASTTACHPPGPQVAHGNTGLPTVPTEAEDVGGAFKSLWPSPPPRWALDA